jgi:hypothetical protein
VAGLKWRHRADRDLRAVCGREHDLDDADRKGHGREEVHRINRLGDGRRRVSYRMEITGPVAEGIGPHLGLQISSEFPETLSVLVE